MAGSLQQTQGSAVRGADLVSETRAFRTEQNCRSRVSSMLLALYCHSVLWLLLLVRISTSVLAEARNVVAGYSGKLDWVWEKKQILWHSSLHLV